MTLQTEQQGNGMPEGAELEKQIADRHRRGAIWLAIFQVSLILAIVILTALLFNIINQSFGLVAMENAVDPGQLVALHVEDQMIAAPNTTTSEDDTTLANAIAADPNAIGFFGYAYYQNRQDELRALAVNGVEPNSATANDGSYELARPLFLYAPATVLETKPQVASFLDFYLANVNNEIDDVGYFAVEQEMLDRQVNALRTTTGGELTSVNEGDIVVAGSSTVYPLTVRMADLFNQAGFTGEITVESTGTKAGYVALCPDKEADIANASRAIVRQESAACKKAKRTPVEFRVGTDAIAVVVSSKNSFLDNLTTDQLQQIFTGANLWSDVDPAWPAEPIVRHIPSMDSGTLDFFVEDVYADVKLADLSKEALMGVLESTVSAGVMRRLENDQPFAERSQANLYELVVERVVEPAVVASWNLLPSIFNRAEIEASIFASNSDAELTFHSWINRNFLTSTQSSVPEQAGVRTAILGSLWVILITLLFAVPVGIGAAIYLEEYAAHGRLNQILQTNIDNLAGVPSIIYGILGLAIFVRFLEQMTSGKAFGFADPTTANGRTIVSAGLTLGLLVLPIIIINAQEAIRAVPQSLREAGYGLGATKWQVVRTHVLTNALPGILTGTILAMSRAVGETAPLIVIGASTFITVDPNGPFSKFTVMPMQIYQWTTRPQAEFQHIAAAASIVLLLLLFALNATAIFLRNRYSKQM